MNKVLVAVFILLLPGCASVNEALGFKKLEVPPEFSQKVLLQVSDQHEQYRAPKSGYDIGDLQSFHTQHTLPITIEGAFKEMFENVELLGKGPRIEMGEPDVPAIFEVRITELNHQNYVDFKQEYLADLTLVVAMKSPKDRVFWQQGFRGYGRVTPDTDYSLSRGPDEAVVDALHDAIDQMQKAIIKSPDVLAQLRYYQDINAARAKEDASF